MYLHAYFSFNLYIYLENWFHFLTENFWSNFCEKCCHNPFSWFIYFSKVLTLLMLIEYDNNYRNTVHHVVFYRLYLTSTYVIQLGPHSILKKFFLVIIPFPHEMLIPQINFISGYSSLPWFTSLFGLTLDKWS